MLAILPRHYVYFIHYFLKDGGLSLHGHAERARRIAHAASSHHYSRRRRHFVPIQRYMAPPDTPAATLDARRWPGRRWLAYRLRARHVSSCGHDAVRFTASAILHRDIICYSDSP